MPGSSTVGWAFGHWLHSADRSSLIGTQARYLTPPEGHNTGIPKAITANDVQRLPDRAGSFASSVRGERMLRSRFAQTGPRFGPSSAEEFYIG